MRIPLSLASVCLSRCPKEQNKIGLHYFSEFQPADMTALFEQISSKGNSAQLLLLCEQRGRMPFHYSERVHHLTRIVFVPDVEPQGEKFGHGCELFVP